MVVKVFIVVTFMLCKTKSNELKKEPMKISETEPENTPAYRIMYKTSDGVEREEVGVFKNTPVGRILSVTGKYVYEVDGTLVSVVFIADERGYRPIVLIAQKPENEPRDVFIGNRIGAKVLATLAGGGIG